MIDVLLFITNAQALVSSLVNSNLECLMVELSVKKGFMWKCYNSIRGPEKGPEYLSSNLSQLTDSCWALRGEEDTFNWNTYI